MSDNQKPHEVVADPGLLKKVADEMGLKWVECTPEEFKEWADELVSDIPKLFPSVDKSKKSGGYIIPTLIIPAGANAIIRTLEQNGYEAYIVGGCVRDSILMQVPNDWDICTSATPEEIIACFSRQRIIETGLKHGTVTVIAGDGNYEVTTFRKDGRYTDNRRPERVEFVSSLVDDLARRDFTVNAMAYNPTTGLIDPFGGVQDIADDRLRCVGNADERFNEDALRILRAIRFAATYPLYLTEDVKDAIHRNAHLLRNISMERISAELIKIVAGPYSTVLLQFGDVLSEIIPEIAPSIGFNQKNKWHRYTVYDHMVRSTMFTKDAVVGMTLLLHDIGKPDCYTEDEQGCGHFYGHAERSAEIAEKVVARLRLSSKMQRDVVELIRYHDVSITATPKTIRRLLNKLGEEQFFRLLEVRIGDVSAHSAIAQEERLDICRRAKAVAQRIIAERQCFSLKDLAVDGCDILDLGVPEGKQIGVILRSLLRRVIDGKIQNERTTLIEYAKSKYIPKRKETAKENTFAEN